MEIVLFPLIRLGLGTTSIDKENLSDFIMLTPAQWQKIGDVSQEQGVLGIVLDGIEKLENTRYGLTKGLSADIKLQWIGEVLQGYEVGNQNQRAVISFIQKKWAESNIRMMVMKGQAMGVFYPNPIHRSPGDIDCYLFDGYAEGNVMAKLFADYVDESWYKHSVIGYKGETIENHRFFVHTREGELSKQLNQTLLNTLKDVNFNKLPDTDVLLPPPMFNALFLTYHALGHFLEEGLRLKQVLDWAMFLKRDSDKVDWNEFYRICDKYHFRRFADVMNDIAVHYLGVELNCTGITTTSPFTDRVLHSTLYDMDYVFNTGKGGWSNRLHIVKNLVKYRWKYHQIYQRSVLKQLMYYIIGFFLKTEDYQ